MGTKTISKPAVIAIVFLTVTACIVVIVTSGRIPGTAKRRVFRPHTLQLPSTEEAQFPFSEIPKDRALLTEEQERTRKEPIPEYPFQHPDWYLKLKSALMKQIDIDFSETPFEDAVAEVARKTRVRIEIDKAVDEKDYTLSLRLRGIKALNALALVLAVDENLDFELAPDGVCVKFGKDIEQHENARILMAIESAREDVYLLERRDNNLQSLQSTEPHLFNWFDKTTDDAIWEIRITYRISYSYSDDAFKAAINSEAPQVRWKGNAADALKWVLKNAELTYRYYNNNPPELEIFTQEEQRTKEKEEEERLEAFEQFAFTILSGVVKNEPLHKLIEMLGEQTGVCIYPDKATWEAGVRVTIPGENPTVKQLLDYLREKHSVKHWFELDSETNQETLYLLESG
jgi:hypothetical protein